MVLLHNQRLESSASILYGLRSPASDATGWIDLMHRRGCSREGSALGSDNNATLKSDIESRSILVESLVSANASAEERNELGLSGKDKRKRKIQYSTCSQSDDIEPHCDVEEEISNNNVDNDSDCNFGDKEFSWDVYSAINYMNDEGLSYPRKYFFCVKISLYNTICYYRQQCHLS